MDILVATEGLDHPLVAAYVRHNSQFYLRVVGCQDDVLVVGCHKGLADVPPTLGTHRDVLQVRIHRTQPPGGGDRLRERGVDAARLGVDELRQRIDVGGLQLGEFAPFQDQRHDGMLVRQLQQHFFAGLVLLALGEFGILDDGQTLKQHLAQLFG